MIRNLTGFNQLQGNKRLESLCSTSQSCASGTCDCYKPIQKDLYKRKKIQKIVLQQLEFERAS